MNRKTVLSLFIVFIMVFSIFGIVIDSFTQTVTSTKYNGFKFIQTQYGWRTVLDDKEIFFNFFPTEIEHVEIPQQIVEKMSSTKALHVTYDSENQDAELLANLQFLLEAQLATHKSIFVSRGTLTQIDDSPLPQITCANATQLMPVVLLNITNSTKIYEENNCIYFEGNTENVFMLTEKLIYLLTGIMK